MPVDTVVIAAAAKVLIKDAITMVTKVVKLEHGHMVTTVTTATIATIVTTATIVTAVTTVSRIKIVATTNVRPEETTIKSMMVQGQETRHIKKGESV